MVISKELFLEWWNNCFLRGTSVFGLEKVNQKPYNSSIKPMESTSRPMQFLGFSNHEKEASRQENCLFHYPPEAYSKRSAARF
jgi:hypothetical protein